VGQTPKQALDALKANQTQNRGSKIQILLLKNLKDYHSTTLYTEIQSLTLDKGFSSRLGNYLKDYPLILNYSPVISFQHATPILYDDTKIYNLRGNMTVQLTELSSLNKGWIYGMILYTQPDAMED
jgi:hypothetical protein